MADEGQKKLGEIIGKCWKDGAFKQRFVSDPRSVLKEHNIDVPPNVQVKVVENTASQFYITLPPSPQGGGREVSDAQLDQVAGGLASGYSSSLYSPLLRRLAIVNTQSGGNGSTCYKDCIPW